MMITDKLTLICLAAWALLFGLFAVTNVQVSYGPTIEGIAAIAVGVVCIVRAVR
jgi:hypothetical protein